MNLNDVSEELAGKLNEITTNEQFKWRIDSAIKSILDFITKMIPEAIQDKLFSAEEFKEDVEINIIRNAVALALQDIVLRKKSIEEAVIPRLNIEFGIMIIEGTETAYIKSFKLYIARTMMG